MPLPRPPNSSGPLRHWRASDLRSAAQLAAQATTSVSHIAEAVHQAVWSTMGVPGGKAPGLTRGITGLVYRSVRGVTGLVGQSLDTVLARLEPVLASAELAAPGSPLREAVLAALNGVMGDRLAAMGSPLATPMTLRWQGEALRWQTMPAPRKLTGKLLVLVHGLCMNDLQWHTQTGGDEEHPAVAVDHGAALADALGYTPVYLRYNTGLHVSQNGHELAAQLEQLLAHWPVPVTELSVVAHSMGGLVMRSAMRVAMQGGMAWPDQLNSMVFLGTPHHGAPLERAGNWVDVMLGATPFSKPFARLAQLRSAGITDLRYGLVTDEDWQGHDRFERKADNRLHVPLPEGVACYTVAATTAAQRSPLAERLIGDGLVPLPSALGQHEDPARKLVFAKPSQRVAYGTNHMKLLSSPQVTEQLLKWLTPN